mmetsp:Transcript_20512/g.63821  ORF Transcript_20512/g.63821 Transcript_20512/m.63821 type:complete len:289 (-) Transcript_20512:16-882(-)
MVPVRVVRAAVPVAAVVGRLGGVPVRAVAATLDRVADDDAAGRVGGVLARAPAMGRRPAAAPYGSLLPTEVTDGVRDGIRAETSGVVFVVLRTRPTGCRADGLADEVAPRPAGVVGRVVPGTAGAGRRRAVVAGVDAAGVTEPPSVSSCPKGSFDSDRWDAAPERTLGVAEDPPLRRATTLLWSSARRRQYAALYLGSTPTRPLGLSSSSSCSRRRAAAYCSLAGCIGDCRGGFTMRFTRSSSRFRASAIGDVARLPTDGLRGCGGGRRGSFGGNAAMVLATSLGRSQ